MNRLRCPHNTAVCSWVKHPGTSLKDILCMHSDAGFLYEHVRSRKVGFMWRNDGMTTLDLERCLSSTHALTPSLTSFGTPARPMEEISSCLLHVRKGRCGQTEACSARSWCRTFSRSGPFFTGQMNSEWLNVAPVKRLFRGPRGCPGVFSTQTSAALANYSRIFSHCGKACYPERRADSLFTSWSWRFWRESQIPECSSVTGWF